MTHWTSQSTDAFVRRITFDFWTQIQKRMDVLPVSQFDLASLFGVSESAISQTLNNSKNPQIRTLVSYAKALKYKVAIVPYPDDDPEDRPVNSEIFTICWEKAGRPHTFGQANAVRSIESAFNYDSLIIPAGKTPLVRKYQFKKEKAATHWLFERQLPLLFGAGISLKSDAQMQTATTRDRSVKAA